MWIDGWGQRSPWCGSSFGMHTWLVLRVLPQEYSCGSCTHETGGGTVYHKQVAFHCANKGVYNMYYVIIYNLYAKLQHRYIHKSWVGILPKQIRHIGQFSSLLFASRPTWHFLHGRKRSLVRDFSPKGQATNGNIMKNQNKQVCSRNPWGGSSPWIHNLPQDQI